VRAPLHLIVPLAHARKLAVLCLVTAAACSAQNEGADVTGVDGATDRTTDSISEPGTTDGGEDRSRVDVEAGSDDRMTDMSSDVNNADNVSDRPFADDGNRDTDPRSDASEGGQADSGAGGNDAGLDGNGDAGIGDSAADRASDSTADRSGDGAGDAGSEGGDGGTRKPSGVFGGGPFYHDADTVMPTMRASGFTTMVLWSIHVRTNGDLVLNDVPIFANGSYIGSDAAWPGKVATLKTAPTSVTRVEFSVGAGGTTDF